MVDGRTTTNIPYGSSKVRHNTDGRGPRRLHPQKKRRPDISSEAKSYTQTQTRTEERSSVEKGERKKDKRLAKPKIPKQTRITDYVSMDSRVYGNELRDPQVFGSEDSRRTDSGVH